RRRRRLQSRHAVARSVLAHDVAPRANSLDPEFVHANFGGAIILPQRAGGPAGSRMSLASRIAKKSRGTPPASQDCLAANGPADHALFVARQLLVISDNY